jgi:hypothetical protein
VAIVCIGETLEQRDAGQVEAVLHRQIEAGLHGLTAKELGDSVLAYEPVWAIGTGRTATPEQAQAAHAFIRKTLAELWDAGAAVIEVITVEEPRALARGCTVDGRPCPPALGGLEEQRAAHEPHPFSPGQPHLLDPEREGHGQARPGRCRCGAVGAAAGGRSGQARAQKGHDPYRASA